MGYIDKIKHIAQKVPNITDDELVDQFVRGYIQAFKKKSLERAQIHLKRHIIFLKDAHARMHWCSF